MSPIAKTKNKTTTPIKKVTQPTIAATSAKVSTTLAPVPPDAGAEVEGGEVAKTTPAAAGFTGKTAGEDGDYEDEAGPVGPTQPAVAATTAAPVANATLPVANTTLPVANATLPVANATLPVANTTLPASNKTKANPCVDDTCVMACDKDNAFFPGGVLSVPESKGKIATVCGRKYFFSKENLTHAAAAKACCALGMTLSTIDAPSEQTCLVNYNMNVTKAKSAGYWVGATSSACEKNFTWCSGAPVSSGLDMWVKLMPTRVAGENCLMQVLDVGTGMVIAGQQVPGDNGFNDGKCADLNTYLCEEAANDTRASTGPNNSTSGVATAKPKTNQCEDDTCVMACEKNTTLFPGGVLTVPEAKGSVATLCSRKYFFSKEKLQRTAAASACCSMGMVLTSIETAEEQKCISDHNKNVMKLTKTAFWTSATSKSCDRKFLWCGGLEVPTASKIHTWVFPNPNFVPGENCLVQSLDAGGSNLGEGLDDSLCTDDNSYICEEASAPSNNTVNTTPAGSNSTSTGNIATVKPKTNPCMDDICAMACEKNNALFPAGTLTVPDTKGSVTKLCEKKYFFSKEKKTLELAAKECCAMGMSLASLETKAEQDCILDHNKNAMKLTGISFWTSATSRACDKKFTWCSGSVIPTDNKIHTWSPPNPNFVSGENCVLQKFEFGSMVPLDGFEDNVCTGENVYLCEEGSAAAAGANTSTSAIVTVKPKSDPCMDDTCAMACEKDNAFFPGGILTVPESKGSTVTLCNKKYFISKEKKTFEAAAKACCALGMSLVSLETRAEQDCIHDHNKNVMKLKDAFWTSATSRACDKKFTWCTGSQIPTDSKIHSWIITDPNYAAGENCIIQSFDQGSPIPREGIEDAICTNEILYICEEGSSSTATSAARGAVAATVKPKSNPCIDDSCVTACEKDNAFFPGGTLTVPASKGTLTTACNRKYFFSKEKKTHELAGKACCALGMGLVSMETKDEQSCLMKHNSDVLKEKQSYWTSATSKSCDKKFFWCTGTEIASGFDWVGINPNFATGENCISQYLDVGTVVFGVMDPTRDEGLMDSLCTDEMYYICEQTD